MPDNFGICIKNCMFSKWNQVFAKYFDKNFDELNIVSIGLVLVEVYETQSWSFYSEIMQNTPKNEEYTKYKFWHANFVIRSAWSRKLIVLFYSVFIPGFAK